MSKEWSSNAKWPEGSVCQSRADDKTTDFHETELAARAVCRMLRRDGLGGEGRVFPKETWVEHKNPDGKWERVEPPLAPKGMEIVREEGEDKPDPNRMVSCRASILEEIYRDLHDIARRLKEDGLEWAEVEITSNVTSRLWPIINRKI